MGKMIVWGLIASAFFSLSFVLYQLMSVQGGHWFWSASLRCLFMWLLLTVIIVIKNRGQLTQLIQLWHLFWQNWRFWMFAGSIALGTYGLLAFAADYAEGWVIAATYLFTVVASLIVLKFFGQHFSKKTIYYSVVVFVGVVLANVGEGLRHQTVSSNYTLQSLLVGAMVAFIASFFFPVGNQLVWQASQPKQTNLTTELNIRKTLLQKLPYIHSPLLDNALHKVWLMAMGSLPMWAALTLILHPPAPSPSQITLSFLVALTAGVLGTSVFLFARAQATRPQQLAAIDATQGSEIIFALLGGMLLLGTPLPSLLSFVGIALVIIGLTLFGKAND